MVILDAEIGIGLGIEANITIINIRFNSAIKLNIYIGLTEKACILLRI